MTRFKSVSLSLHFRFSPAVTLLSVSITAKCQHHVWLIIRWGSYSIGCHFVLIRHDAFKTTGLQMACKTKGLYSESSSTYTWILYPCICWCEVSRASHRSTVKVKNITSCVPASFHSNWAKCQHHRRPWAVLQSNKWSALANTLLDVVDVRDVRCSPREGVTACVSKTQPKEVRNI